MMMRPFLNKPKFTKYNDYGKGNGLEYSVTSLQGWRTCMEDKYTVHCVLKDLPKWSFFGIFDGHGGYLVASVCANYLEQEIMNQKYMKDLAESKCEECVHLVEEAILTAFFSFDRKAKNLSTDPDVLDKCGSTVSCVLISPTHYYFINCGDSRAVLCRGGRVHFATVDHKPYNPKEEKRIKEAGGRVIMDRINGSLAVSRGIGDYAYKQAKNRRPNEQMVSPEPDITPIARRSEDDEFIMIASDGIFDYFTSNELRCFIMKRHKFKQPTNKMCNDAVDFGLKKVSLLL